MTTSCWDFWNFFYLFALAKVTRVADTCRAWAGQRFGLTAARAAALLAEARGRISRCWAWAGRPGLVRRPSFVPMFPAWRRSAMLRAVRYGATQTDCIPQTAEEWAWLDGLTEEQFDRMLVLWGDRDLRISIGQWISAGY
jgi:hypothetical protein